jgi:hypothetical protein
MSFHRRHRAARVFWLPDFEAHVRELHGHTDIPRKQLQKYPTIKLLVMERTIYLPRNAADMLLECPVLCGKLGLDGLARLATCSKASRKAIETFVVKYSLGSLDRALETARQSEQQQHKQAVAWLAAVLLRKAPALAVDVSKRLLHLPSVPLTTAEQLVAAGVRISYAQLLAAAHSMVKGVEVWVQAQQQLGVQSDIPMLAMAVSCGYAWVSKGGTYLPAVTAVGTQFSAGRQRLRVLGTQALLINLYMTRLAGVPDQWVF